MSGTYRGTHGLCNRCKNPRSLLYFNDDTRKVCEECYIDQTYNEESTASDNEHLQPQQSATPKTIASRKSRGGKRKERVCSKCNNIRKTFISKRSHKPECQNCYKKNNPKVYCSQCGKSSPEYGHSNLLKPLCYKCYEIFMHIGVACALCQSKYKVNYRIKDCKDLLQCKTCYDKKRLKSHIPPKHRSHENMESLPVQHPTWLL